MKQTLTDGSALNTFAKFVIAQGGSVEEVKHPELLPKAKYIEDVPSINCGYVANIATEEIGKISLLLGGGRETKESTIDLSVGIVLNKKYGDFVTKGEVLATLHANNQESLIEAKKRLLNSYTLTNEPVEKLELIKHIIE